ncbi:MAG TPA: DUF6588 family protein [Williamwhitmania sp.]|nr:DUF6588 family protein [Williamwhitmania sp.]
MKTYSIAKKLFGAFSLALIPLFSFAQKDVVLLLRSSQQDAVKLSEAYLQPFGKSLGWGLSGSWYNSGKPHGLAGFDLTFSINTVMVPSSDKNFDINSLKLTNISVVSGEGTTSPTVAGSGSGPKVQYQGQVDLGGGVNATQNVQFNLPSGGNLSVIPVPILQAGVGLPFHTEIMGRFIPKVSLPDIGSVSLWGIGIKNEFKELIPGIKLLPFGLSAMVAYTDFRSDINVSYKPQTTNYDHSLYDNQQLKLRSTSLATRIIVSKSLPVLTVYAGLGYNFTKTSMDLKGNYPVGLEMQDSQVVVSGNTNWTDPLSLSFKNNGFAANVGLRIKLAILAFHFDYTVAKYPIITGGVGISFR